MDLLTRQEREESMLVRQQITAGELVADGDRVRSMRSMVMPSPTRVLPTRRQKLREFIGDRSEHHVRTGTRKPGIAETQLRSAASLCCPGLFCVSPSWEIGGAQVVLVLPRPRQRNRQDRQPPITFGEPRSKRRSLFGLGGVWACRVARQEGRAACSLAVFSFSSDQRLGSLSVPIH